MPEKTGQSIEEKLALLKSKFRAELGAKFDNIQTLLDRLADNQQPELALAELYRLVHSLVGAGGTFGMHDMSIQARVFEEPLKQLYQQPELFNTEAHMQLQRLFNDLKNSVSRDMRDSNGVAATKKS